MENWPSPDALQVPEDGGGGIISLKLGNLGLE
jgi:hypothetical protein